MFLRRTRAAVVIQRNVRMWLTRKLFLQQRSAAITIQCLWRAHMARKLYYQVRLMGVTRIWISVRINILMQEVLAAFSNLQCDLKSNLEHSLSRFGILERLDLDKNVLIQLLLEQLG